MLLWSVAAAQADEAGPLHAVSWGDQMKTLPYWFIGFAALFGLAGMLFGIYMSVIQDFTLAPAHAHNNLIGWVTLALYGFYYKAVPAACNTRLALVQFWLALLGAATMGIGIGLAVLEKGETVVQIASVLTVAGMVLFAWIVWSNRPGLTSA